MELTRFYFALTNFCNRACELCSCHSDPTRQTNLTMDQFKEILSTGVPYEAQLEGGEPTIHPDFEEMVAYVANDPLCHKIILCTNAVKMPLILDKKVIQHEETLQALYQWFDKFSNKPFVLKPSVNSHLIRHSTVHMMKMDMIHKAFTTYNKWKEGSELIYNVRRIPKPLSDDDELWITDLLKQMGLYDFCNDFLYQRYGKGKEEEALELPYVVSNPMKFHLIAPDGRDFNTDLIARANYMENMK